MDYSKVISEVIKHGPTLIELFQNDGLDMPNINMPTMGGEVFWNDIYKIEGWRVQQNTITKHCRVLDPDNVRRAWGSEKQMIKNLEKLEQANR